MIALDVTLSLHKVNGLTKKEDLLETVDGGGDVWETVGEEKEEGREEWGGGEEEQM